MYFASAEVVEMFETAALSSIILIMETEAEALSAVGR